MEDARFAALLALVGAQSEALKEGALAMKSLCDLVREQNARIERVEKTLFDMGGRANG